MNYSGNREISLTIKEWNGTEEVGGFGIYLEGKANSLAARLEIGDEGKRKIKSDYRFLPL